MAMGGKPEVKGIVVNAFTEPYVLDKELFDLVENMKTRLTDDDPSEYEVAPPKDGGERV